MRTTRVVLVFFSAGFLAGSFEQAAGVGQMRLLHDGPAARQATGGRPLDSAVVLAAPTAPIEVVTAAVGPSAPGAPETRHAPPPVAERAFARLLLPEPETPGTAEVLAGLGLTPGDLRAMSFGGEPPMSRPSHAAWAPMSAPALVSPFSTPPQPGVKVLPEVPGARLGEMLAPAPQKPAEVSLPEFILPIHRGRVTSMWNQGRRHPAIDLAAPLGTPVRSTTRKQKVTYAGWRGGYGNLVTTRDPEGREHYYGHLQRIFARVGTLLEQGDLLGLLGSTGRSTGPHVHYEVRRRGRHVNPAGLLFPDRRVGRGYAWAEPHAPAATAVAAGSDAVQASRASDRQGRVAKTRRSRARVANNGRRARARMAQRVRGRAAPRRYVQQPRFSRSAGRYAGRYVR